MDTIRKTYGEFEDLWISRGVADNDAAKAALGVGIGYLILDGTDPEVLKQYIAEVIDLVRGVA